MDCYFREHISQDARRGLASPYLAIDHNGSTIFGFYTLSCSSIPTADLPERIARRFAYQQTPIILLGRLAIDQAVQRQGVGTRLLADALIRCYELSRSVAATGVIVDAKDENAAIFYEQRGFERFVSDPLRLFVPMSTIEKMYKDSEPGGD